MANSSKRRLTHCLAVLERVHLDAHLHVMPRTLGVLQLACKPAVTVPLALILPVAASREADDAGLAVLAALERLCARAWVHIQPGGGGGGLGCIAHRQSGLE